MIRHEDPPGEFDNLPPILDVIENTLHPKGIIWQEITARRYEGSLASYKREYDKRNRLRKGKK